MNYTSHCPQINTEQALSMSHIPVHNHHISAHPRLFRITCAVSITRTHFSSSKSHVPGLHSDVTETYSLVHCWFGFDSSLFLQSLLFFPSRLFDHLTLYLHYIFEDCFAVLFCLPRSIWMKHCPYTQTHRTVTDLAFRPLNIVHFKEINKIYRLLYVYANWKVSKLASANPQLQHWLYYWNWMCCSLWHTLCTLVRVKPIFMFGSTMNLLVVHSKKKKK